MYSRKVDKAKGVQCDQIGKLTVLHVSINYPVKLRRVKFYDEETKRAFVFLTNNMELSAEQIALLYKNHWQVELCFKWIVMIPFIYVIYSLFKFDFMMPT
jgi:hypothetical protein